MHYRKIRNHILRLAYLVFYPFRETNNVAGRRKAASCYFGSSGRNSDNVIYDLWKTDTVRETFSK